MLGISTTATAQKSFELRSRIAEQSGNLNQASIELSTGFKQDAYKDVRGVSGDTLRSTRQKRMFSPIAFYQERWILFLIACRVCVSRLVTFLI
jgi:hypothetical protein